VTDCATSLAYFRYGDVRFNNLGHYWILRVLYLSEEGMFQGSYVPGKVLEF
jgi:hypothetical protein